MANTSLRYRMPVTNIQACDKAKRAGVAFSILGCVTGLGNLTYRQGTYYYPSQVRVADDFSGRYLWVKTDIKS